MTSLTADPALSRRQLPTLTGIRALAALLVFFNHVNLEGMFSNPKLNSLALWVCSTPAEMGLCLFFVLSGFVMAWSQPENDTKVAFWRRRFWRIYPNHFVGWTAGLLLMVVAGESVNGWNVVPSLTLVNAWIPRLDALHGTNGPAWSLGAEAFFYFSFPFLMPLIQRIRPSRLWASALTLMAAVITIPFIALLLPDEPRVRDLPIPLWQFWFTSFLPPVRLLEFVLGIVLARIVLTGRWIPIRLGAAWSVLAFCTLVSLFLPTPFNLSAPFVAPLALVIGAATAADLSGRRSLYATRPLMWLGAISFAFYVLHSLVIHYGHLALGGGTWSAPATLLVQTAMVLVTVALSAALHHGVEVPMMRRFGKAKRRPVISMEPLPQHT